ncbi:hypothetical protein ACFFHF_16335 [Robertmurraya beringensis]|uniref:Uncharacterized protein n=1 Tax=Robertmurraya beringensis TaxID=641660 RepID=A0ABV6KTW7_9BACI
MELKDLLDYNFEKRKIIKIIKNIPDHERISKELEASILAARRTLENNTAYKLMNTALKVKSLFDKKNIKDIALEIEIRQTHSALFPGDGFPQIGKVYVCNPIDTRRYYDINHFHEEMINHKIYEAEYFLRSLGATKIEVTNVTDEEYKQRANVSYNNMAEGNTSRNTNNSSRKSWNSTYSPTREPFIPDDLTWYDHDQQWKQIADSRLHSGIESLKFEVSINEDFGINNSLKIPLKNGQYITADTEFGGFKRSVFIIAAEFKSL